jgi:hypothetical protein
MSTSLRFRWIFLVLVIFLLFPFQKAGAGQTTFGMGVRKHSAAQAVTPPVGEAPKPQLLNADSTPTLRYPVSVWESSISCGWLDVTRSGVSYTVVESGRAGKPALKRFAPGEVQHLLAPADAAGGEEFEVRSGEILSIQIVKGSLLQVTFARRAPLLTYLPQDQWGTVEKPRQFMGAAQLNLAGTMAIQRAMQEFDSVLATVKPPAPPPLEVSLRAEPPTVEKGRPVTLVWNSTNATSLDLEPGVGRVAAAGGMSLLPQDSTNYTLTAIGPAGAKAASVYVTVTAPAPAAVPTLVLTEPSAAEGETVEVASSPLVIRGVVMDASGMPVVTVNGGSVTMRPTSAQAAQFRSDPIDLQPGENKFEVVAVNSAHGHAKVTFIARLSSSPPKAQPTETSNSRGLGKAEILSLLKGDVPSERIAALVKERGIKFVPTPDDLKDIRGAGGGDDLIDAINQAPAPTRN